MAVIQFFVVCGLFLIRKRLSYPAATFKVWTSVACVFLASQTFLAISPFIAPGDGQSRLPVWLTPLAATLIFCLGVIYWYTWWVVVPKLGGFVWEKGIVISDDGARAVHWRPVPKT
jgi:hypothetical protein